MQAEDDAELNELAYLGLLENQGSAKIGVFLITGFECIINGPAVHCYHALMYDMTHHILRLRDVGADALVIAIYAYSQ